MKFLRLLSFVGLVAVLALSGHVNAQWLVNGTHIYNDNTGNVAIGHNSPSYLLHAAKIMTEPTICVQNLGSNGGATFQMIDNASGANWKFKATLTGGFKVRDQAFLLDVMVIEPNSEANALYINTNGKLGIGTPTPSSDLDVFGDIKASDSIGVSGGYLITGDFRASLVNGVINCGGANRAYTNVISDLTDPTIFFAIGDEDLYIQGELEVGTNAYKPGGGSWSTLSDARFKKNIEPFSDGLSRLMQIRPVTFQYNEKVNIHDKGKRHVGILAQDMLAVAPYMVEERPVGQVVRETANGVDEILEPGTMAYTFDPSALDYLIINAIQEQQHLIEDQKKSIEKLEMENSLIREELDKIRSAVQALKN